MTPSQYIYQGNQFPYDAPNSWWETKGEPVPPPPEDWAHSAARGIAKVVLEFHDTREESARTEFVRQITSIIRTAYIEKDSIQPVSDDVTRMAENIYGKGVEKALDTLRKSVYKEVGMLMKLQAKGAMIPSELQIGQLRIPLNPEV